MILEFIELQIMTINEYPPFKSWERGPKDPKDSKSHNTPNYPNPDPNSAQSQVNLQYSSLIIHHHASQLISDRYPGSIE